MNAKEFLAKKGVHNLDTKKRYNEVISWMEEYAALRQHNVEQSERLKCEHKGRRTATEFVEYCEDCKKILFHP